MLTDKEFDSRWTRISKKGRKFIVRYIENGLDAHDAAAFADFHGKFLKSPTVPLRKYNDIINYLLKKNNIIDTFVKPEWVLSQMKKLYDSSQSESIKLGVLTQLSKILSLINTDIKIENNIPTTPVVIRFDKDDK